MRQLNAVEGPLTIHVSAKSDPTSFQKTFEDWVRRNVNVRECIKFIKKKDNKDDPM